MGENLVKIIWIDWTKWQRKFINLIKKSIDPRWMIKFYKNLQLMDLR